MRLLRQVNVCISGVGRSSVLTYASFTPVTVKACMLGQGGGRERGHTPGDKGTENDTPVQRDYGEQEG